MFFWKLWRKKSPKYDLKCSIRSYSKTCDLEAYDLKDDGLKAYDLDAGDSEAHNLEIPDREAFNLESNDLKIDNLEAYDLQIEESFSVRTNCICVFLPYI